MLYSALNFAIGFFGYPHQDQYLQEITIEAPGVSHYLPYLSISSVSLNFRRFDPYLTSSTTRFVRTRRKRSHLVRLLSSSHPDISSLSTSCPNAVVPSRAERAVPYVYEWTSIYLKDAVKRINALVDGLHMDFVDVYTMQQVCAYEVRRAGYDVGRRMLTRDGKTVALGYSKFCELFTEDEWEGFEYT